jgi:hypothetical protein
VEHTAGDGIVGRDGELDMQQERGIGLAVGQVQGERGKVYAVYGAQEVPGLPVTCHSLVSN